MNADQRSVLLDDVQETQRRILLAKGGDYANADVLSNFKLAGNICQISPEKQCLSLIATKVARLGVLIDGSDPNNEAIEDSVIDLMNYGFLLYCLLTEDDNDFTSN